MGNQKSILIVDDEPNNFDVIEILLFKENYALNYASTGHEALEQIQHHPPDVILLDVMMPDMDGIEVCRRIRKNVDWRHIPIIVVTALNSKEDLAQCLAAGADDFISKPVSGVEIRARVRSMLRIRQQYTDLQESLQLREDLANMIVHDLRNPLTSITLTCDLLRLIETSGKTLEKVEQISIAGQQLQTLVDSLLTTAKLQSGKLVPNLTENDLHEIGVSVLSDFSAIAAQKNIQLLHHFPEPGGCALLDAILFRRILDNLLSNAIKFSPSNSQVTLHLEYPAGKQVRVQVSDRGPGVSKEFKQSIFEKYEIGGLIKGASQTGLGLAFCKLAVESHQGQITVAENSPTGSVFTVEI